MRRRKSASSLARLEQLTGKRVRGWFGAGGGETVRTPEVLEALRDRVHARLVAR